jgi:hypothetical protein
MLICGRALAYHREKHFEPSIRSTDESVERKAPTRVLFYSGACTDAIYERQPVEIQLNHARQHDLGATERGLHLFETIAGLYFYLRLPSTPFAESVYRAVVDAKIRYVCAMSNQTHGDEIDGVFIVKRADLRALSLLITAPPHDPYTWVMVAGPEAEGRIDAEATAEASRQYWALDKSIPAWRAPDRLPIPDAPGPLRNGGYAPPVSFASLCQVGVNL